MKSESAVDKPRVFISYAHEDKVAAEKLYLDLRKYDINAWIDSEYLLPGQKWKTEIKQAIRESRFFIALLSENSIRKRGFVQSELAEALEILREFPESDCSSYL